MMLSRIFPDLIPQFRKQTNSSLSVLDDFITELLFATDSSLGNKIVSIQILFEKINKKAGKCISTFLQKVFDGPLICFQTTHPVGKTNGCASLRNFWLEFKHSLHISLRRQLIGDPFIFIGHKQLLDCWIRKVLFEQPLFEPSFLK